MNVSEISCTVVQELLQELRIPYDKNKNFSILVFSAVKNIRLQTQDIQIVTSSFQKMESQKFFQISAVLSNGKIKKFVTFYRTKL